MRFFFLLFALSSITISSLSAQPARVGEVRDFHWTADSTKAEGSERGGRVLRHTISIPGAPFLKPHIASLHLAPGESLVFLSGDGAVVETVRGGDLRGRASMGGRPFWALAVPGDRLIVELRLRRVSERHPLVIDRLAVGDQAAFQAVTSPPWQDGAATKSLCGAPDFEDAFCYQGDAAKFANALATAGILTVVNGSVFWCTGVNVSPRNLVLTTESCLASSAACQNAEFVFGYYRDGCGDSSPVAAGWQSYHCQETVATSPFGNICDPTPTNLDFSLHRVAGDPSSEWGWADPETTPLISGEALYIPQHADGRPLEITHGNGADVEVDGMTLRYYGTLDTESSSVGAPIFRDADDRLVALHHCGGCASPGVGNRGVMMADIRPLIEDFLCQPTLTLEPAPAASLGQLSGNGDGVLDPGEIWQVTPKIRNASCDLSTTNISASLQVGAGSAPITLLDTATSVGSLGAGTSGPGTPIRFRVDAAAPCSGAVEIDLVSITSDGGAFAGESAYFSAEIGQVPETTLFAESFDIGVPLTWTIVDGGSSMGDAASTWTGEDPGGRELFETPFFIVDSEFLGPGETMDEELITPIIDASGPTHVTLRFQHNFRYWMDSLDEQADVDVRSSATGGTWVNVASYQGADAAGAVSLDLSPHRGTDLQVRFHYYQAEWEWWWAIDDLEIVGDEGRMCTESLFFDGFELGDTSAWALTSP